MKGIYLDYNSPIRIGEKMKIILRISNEYGFISDVKVLFNQYGQKPGEEAVIPLIYCKEKSDENSSSFIGEVKFNSLGYRTFFVSLKENDIEQNIGYDSANNLVVFETKQKNLEF